MALFKILKGLSTNLSSQTITPGYCYFTPDNKKFYIDWEDDRGNKYRSPLNAEMADHLLSEWDDIDPNTGAVTTHHAESATLMPVINNSNTEIPTSKAVFTEFAEVDIQIALLQSDKMDKENPTGWGYMSINRKAGTSEGNYSAAIGYNNTASGDTSIALGYVNTASGKYSIAIGNNNTASQEGAVALGQSNTASGKNSTAIGIGAVASGEYSVAEGHNTAASGKSSHAEGEATKAVGENSHAQGNYTYANSKSQHVEGEFNVKDTGGTATTRGTYAHIIGNGTADNARSNAFAVRWDGSVEHGANAVASGANSYAGGSTVKATGSQSHAEGSGTTAAGNYSHTEGLNTNVYAGIPAGHAEGTGTIVNGDSAHAEGKDNTVNAPYAHVEGNGNIISAAGISSHAEGYNTSTTASYAHAEGTVTVASGQSSHTEGDHTEASAQSAHAEGSYTKAQGVGAHSEGYYTEARKNYSHAEGDHSITNEVSSHAEGYYTQATNKYSHSEGNYTQASGESSHAEGEKTKAKGKGSHAEGLGGNQTTTNAESGASGDYSHSEGNITIASGNYSHSEGNQTVASGASSHAEGASNTASGIASHAEGASNIASGEDSHAEGFGSSASNKYAHAEGRSTSASGESAHSEGDDTVAQGKASHAEGYSSQTTGDYSHAEGQSTLASGSASHAEGYGSQVTASYAHAEGERTISKARGAHAEGTNVNSSGTALAARSITVGSTTASVTYTTSEGIGSHSEGAQTYARGYASHAEGEKTTAWATDSHAEGNSTLASGNYSHAEGSTSTALGSASHAEGNGSVASGLGSHAEGYSTATAQYSHSEGKATATGENAHAEGAATASALNAHAEGSGTASGQYSHAEGSGTTASGNYSHAEGHSTQAKSAYSHAEGYGTIADGANAGVHVQGKFNLDQGATGTYVHIIGDGTSTTARSNLHTVNNDGTAWYKGDLYVNGDSQTVNSKKVATEQYVLDSRLPIKTWSSSSAYTSAPLTAINKVPTLSIYSSMTKNNDEIYFIDEPFVFNRTTAGAVPAPGSGTGQTRFLTDDSTWVSLSGTYLPITGGTLTGTLGVSGYATTSINYGVPTYQGSSNITTTGLNISQGQAESSGIQFTGDYITMWSPCDSSLSLRYVDEDNGTEVWNISSTGVFSGSCSKFNVTNSTGTWYVAGCSTYNGQGAGYAYSGIYVTGGTLRGAAWNDYAEYRKAETIEPGRCIIEHKSGEMKLSTERMMPGAEIISDTFGFAIGETDKCKTPIAATGRVLAYPNEDRNSYPLGAAVCSGPNGTVSLMTREEIKEYPERIIGTVSEIPDYKTWGEGNVEVNGRIWIRIR